MRNAFCNALTAQAGDPDWVFLTGDLGFMALEPLRSAMGARFINAGVAEQNMISVAAGLAKTGFTAWAYSIAPFIYARPFEQIRNDVCLHNLPVRLVGNGGGYAYGVMGGTHHAIEDYGTLLCLINMRAFIPLFDDDVWAICKILAGLPGPAYLRLGLSEQPKEFPVPPYAAWRKLVSGGGPTLVAIGPIAGGIMAEAMRLNENQRPSVWGVSELPIESLPPEFVQDLAASGHLVVVEEHVAHGGAGQMLAAFLMQSGLAPRRFSQRCAVGYASGLYGSQSFHRRESGLDAAGVIANLAETARLE